MEWTGKHILTAIYLLFGHLTDGELTKDEIKKATDKIHEWTPGDDIEVTNSIFIEVFEEIEKFENSDALVEFMEDMINRVPEFISEKKYLRAILEDLVAVAKADGKFDENEKNMIDVLSKLWNVEFHY